MVAWANRIVARLLIRLTPVFWALLAVPTCASAQYRIDVWNTDNGLPQNSVNSVTQTRDGYLWLTTLDGLVRYDGANFKVFNRSNTAGLTTNRFIALLEDAEGNLWVCTEDRELILYRDGRFTPCSTLEGWPGRAVYKLLLDAGGSPLFHSNDGILTWRDGKFISHTQVDLSHSYVFSDKGGAIWRIRRGLLHRLADETAKTYRLNGAVPYAEITSVFEDRGGAFWIGTRGAGAFKFQDEKLISYTVREGLPSNTILSFCQGRDGNLWLATAGGVCIMSGDRVTTISTAQGLSSNLVRTVFEDREGTIWVGTINAGLNRLTRQSVTFYSKKEGLSHNNIYPICEDREGNLWLGGEGLILYKDGRFTPRTLKEGPVLVDVSAFHVGRDGRFWIAGFESLFYLKHGKKFDFAREAGISTGGNVVNAIQEDSRGNLWIGTSAALFSYRDGRMIDHTASGGYGRHGVRAFLEDRNGNLWIGTYGGLLRFENDSFVSFTEREGLSSNHVRSLYEDDDGTLWIGTYDGGLSRFKDGKFTRYRMSDGLFSEGVFQILDDSRGNFWMSSNRGIYRTRRQQLNDFAEGRIRRITCVSYGKQEGLLTTECNGGRQPAGIRASDGRLWFPTQGGVAVIDPEAVPFNPQPPPVVIESCQIDGEEVGFQTGIELAPGAKNLEIGYAGLSFIKPEMVTFRYRLTGLDSDWVEAGTRRVAYYPHIPPGSYGFEVIAANADGVWSTVGARMGIRVIPPFWRTWWFTSLVALSVAAGAGLLYEYRISRLRKAKAAQEAFSRRLIESQESERKRIAAELHDSLGQNLLIIKNRALIALTEAETIQDARKQLDQISSMSSQALDEVRQISYNLRPFQIDRLGLTKSIRSMLRRVGDSSGIDFVVDIDPIDGLFSKEAEMSLFRIVQESVNNIVKHSEASEARVAIKREEFTLQVRIEDNGKGFDPDAMATNGNGGFGLTGISERARMIGGRYSIQSAPGDGTSVSITIGFENGRGER